MKLTPVSLDFSRAGSTMIEAQAGTGTFMVPTTILDPHLIVKADIDISDELLNMWRGLQGVKQVKRLGSKRAELYLDGHPDRAGAFMAEDADGLCAALPTKLG